MKCLKQASFPVLREITLFEDPPNMKHLENVEWIIMNILLKAITGFIRQRGKFPETQNKGRTENKKKIYISGLVPHTAA